MLLAIEDMTWWLFIVLVSIVMIHCIRTIKKHRVFNAVVLIVTGLLLYITSHKNHVIIASSIYLALSTGYLIFRKWLENWFYDTFQIQPKSELFGIAFYLLLTTMTVWTLTGIIGFRISNGLKPLHSPVAVTPVQKSEFVRLGLSPNKDSSVYTTNQDVICIGRTNDYIFFFQISNKRSIVLSKDRIHIFEIIDSVRPTTNWWEKPANKLGKLLDWQ